MTRTFIPVRPCLGFPDEFPHYPRTTVVYVYSLKYNKHFDTRS